MGAGALGSVVGGFLGKAGNDVTLLGREGHVKAIQERGLKITGVKGENVVSIPAFSNSSDVNEADFLILATKLKDTREALEGISHLYPRIKVALSFQNGILKDELLKKVLGKEKVLCAVTTIGATLVLPGIVNFTGAGITYIGEYDGESERVGRTVSMLNSAGIEARSHADAQAILWAKIMRYLPTSVIAALTRLPQPKYLTQRAAAELNIILTREIASVARKNGIDIKDFYKLPILTLTEGDFDAAVEKVMASARKMGDTGVDAKPSMLQDIERGRKTEIEETAGYIISEAHGLDVDVPHLETCYRLIRTVDEWLG